MYVRKKIKTYVRLNMCTTYTYIRTYIRTYVRSLCILVAIEPFVVVFLYSQLLVHSVGPTTVGTMVLVVVTMCVSVEISSMDQIVPTKDVSCYFRWEMYDLFMVS